MLKRLMLPAARAASIVIAPHLTSKRTAFFERDGKTHTSKNAKQAKEAGISKITDHPESKLSIVDSRTIGFLEAYYNHLEAKNNKRIQIIVYEKNSLTNDWPVGSLAPNLTLLTTYSIPREGNKFSDVFNHPLNVRGRIRASDLTSSYEQFLQVDASTGNMEIKNA